MVFPFELYCRRCGTRVLRAKATYKNSEVSIAFPQDEMALDSWISMKMRGRHLVCPGCKREIHADPLIRAEVLFSEWSGEDGTDPIVYFV
jgi:hypothetical protein